MSRPPNFAPQALRDLEDAAGWLAETGGAALAERLLSAALDAAALLSSRPLMGRQRLGLLPEPYRFWSIASFPYLLVYDASHSPPRVIRMLHTARDLPKLLTDLDS